MALLQIGGWDDDVHHITLDESGPGPNERRALMRRRIAWAAATLIALAALATIIVQVAS